MYDSSFNKQSQKNEPHYIYIYIYETFNKLASLILHTIRVDDTA